MLILLHEKWYVFFTLLWWGGSASAETEKWSRHQLNYNLKTCRRILRILDTSLVWPGAWNIRLIVTHDPTMSPVKGFCYAAFLVLLKQDCITLKDENCHTPKNYSGLMILQMKSVMNLSAEVAVFAHPLPFLSRDNSIHLVWFLLWFMFSCLFERNQASPVQLLIFVSLPLEQQWQPLAPCLPFLSLQAVPHTACTWGEVQSFASYYFVFFSAAPQFILPVLEKNSKVLYL